MKKGTLWIAASERETFKQQHLAARQKPALQGKQMSMSTRFSVNAFVRDLDNKRGL